MENKINRIELNWIELNWSKVESWKYRVSKKQTNKQTNKQTKQNKNSNNDEGENKKYTQSIDSFQKKKKIKMCGKGCCNAYNLWRFYMISTFHT